MEDNKDNNYLHESTMRNEDERKKLLHRLSRIEGQIRGIKNMIENNSYCVDILTQTSAANAALSAFARELFSCHMRSCVARDIREGNDEVLDELIQVLQKFMK